MLLLLRLLQLNTVLLLLVLRFRLARQQMGRDIRSCSRMRVNMRQQPSSIARSLAGSWPCCLLLLQRQG
jgi:hypothetical protein